MYNEEYFFEAVTQSDLDTVRGMITGRLINNAYMNVNLRGDGKDTPLTYAISHGFEEIALCLIDHGADINTPNSTGVYPLKLAESLPTVFAKLKALNAKEGPETRKLRC